MDMWMNSIASAGKVALMLRRAFFFVSHRKQWRAVLPHPRVKFVMFLRTLGRGPAASQQLGWAWNWPVLSPAFTLSRCHSQPPRSASFCSFLSALLFSFSPFFCFPFLILTLPLMLSLSLILPFLILSLLLSLPDAFSLSPAYSFFLSIILSPPFSLSP